ncbi:PREDICTED: calcium-binding mitochondrial carrier protein SCaMC-2-like isoform X2 [Gekko japonicus]|nr:PREDICTED: calcium-binding mitochondrial carrier protein SCaMC-2-like isoform X2 [Gekko japonicus]
MPAGARRSLASPVVSGVLCQCGGGAAAATSTSPAASGQLPASEASSSPPCLLEQERRFHSLFRLLDVNRDGALCVHDLAVGLGRLGLYRSERDLW